MKSRENLLKYWHSVELFEPQGIPSLKESKPEAPVVAVKDDSLLPWLTTRESSKANSNGRIFQSHFVYIGPLSLEEVRILLESKIGSNPEVFDEYPPGETCLFAFSVNAVGVAIPDSFVLSSCAWATARTLNPGPSDPSWLDGFDVAQETGRRIFQDFLTGNDEGSLKPKPMSVASIHGLTKVLTGQLGMSDARFAKDIRLKSTRGSETSETIDVLNSFFSKDLLLVVEQLKKSNFGRALADYLSADGSINMGIRIDLQSDSRALYKTLEPQKFPIGRWPSKGHHPLVLSQQSAINGIHDTLATKAGVFSVNGPPGTGKTTLLRDLIADIYVQRATQLSKLGSPNNAFCGEKRWKSGDYNRVISVWKPELWGFEIVVASQNNGAVENVTKEVPGIEAIDESWVSKVDYFPEVGEDVTGQKAWALFAATLGNKTNRQDFLKSFWPRLEKDRGFRSYLVQMESSRRNLNEDWNVAVQHFSQTLAVEAKLRQERQGYFDALETLQIIDVQVAAQQSAMATLEAEETETSTRLDVLKEITESKKTSLLETNHYRTENRRYRPSFLEIVFTLGKALGHWSDRDREFGSKIAKKKLELELAQQDEQLARMDLMKIHQRYSTAESNLASNRAKRTALHEQIESGRESLGDHFPDLSVWDTDVVAREKSSPWVDQMWNNARSEVFVAAVNLHKAFISATATQLRRNLDGLADILSGQVPRDAPREAVMEAWRSLFFVVPIISSTFASFDRLFMHLGREAIGWLLIDEAGQSTPQSAVGAIWRAKRMVVVGDPLQLEPIVKSPTTILETLRRHFSVPETLIPGLGSVQQTADRLNVFGTYLEYKDHPIWVGSPLRVHRRCDEPMFSISNHVAYSGMMVHGTVRERGTGEVPESSWVDVQGAPSFRHWIPEEGVVVERLLRTLGNLGIENSDIFLISPFLSVVSELKKMKSKFRDLRVGTIHTVQGKEAPVVILVLGGDPGNPGAKRWASGKPNLVNVAVSRAKRRLYVVGNRKGWETFPYFSVCSARLGSTLTFTT